MNKPIHELQKMGVGLLLGKESILTEIGTEKLYTKKVETYITNDPRMIAALKLLGFEVLEKKTLLGIEMFM
jgi:hypothetical protein